MSVRWAAQPEEVLAMSEEGAHWHGIDSSSIDEVKIHLGGMLSGSDREHDSICVLIFSIDDFENIRRIHGDDVATGVFYAVFQRARSAMRRTDELMATNEYEFVAALRGVSTLNVAEVVARKIRQSLGEPIAVGDLHLHVTLHIGLAITSAEDDATSLVRRAHEALHAV
jgi:GGDEF domain-containing protein